MSIQPSTTRARLGKNADGRLEIFGRGNDKAVYHRWQTAPSNGWNEDQWQPLQGVAMDGEPVVAPNQDGRLDVYARGPDGALWVRWQTAPSNGWNQEGWQPLGKPPGGALASNPVVGQNQDGRLQVFVRSTDNTLWTKWQNEPSSFWRDRWEQLGGTLASEPLVARNADGRLEVFARDNNGTLVHIWQTRANGYRDWPEQWAPLDGITVTGNPSAGMNQDGRLDVYARGTDGALWVRWQTAPSNGWNQDGWQSLGKPSGGALDSDIAVAENMDGRLEIFARGTDGAMWHIWQIKPSSGWSGWESLGGGFTSGPAVARNQDGRLDVYGRRNDGAIWVRWQVAPGGGWVPAGWQSLGGGLIDF